MSGYPNGGNPPQYPPPQNHIYPQIYNPANAPPPYNPAAMAYPAAPGQNPHYPFQPGFAYNMQSTPMQAQPNAAPSMAYPGIAPTPVYGYYPSVTPQIPPAVEWVPSTSRDAAMLSDRAVVAGYEGYDKSPLWVIRARHHGDLIPGKLAIKHHAAYIAWDGKEINVQQFEVCCARPETVRWLECSNGNVPPTAIPAGQTAAAETLYVGRAREQGSLTPGKVHKSHNVLYISFGGKEVPHKKYEVLCTA